jgi:hypothetical protein
MRCGYKNMKTSNVVIQPKRILKILLGIQAVLLLFHLITWYLNRYKIIDLDNLVPLFNLNNETNIPTTFVVLLLGFCALLLFLIAKNARNNKSRFVFHWFLLSAGFFYIAIDEGSMLHELSMKGLSKIFGSGPAGIFTFSWVLLLVILVPILVAVFFNFFRNLPKSSMKRFGLAGSIYVMGAVGFEMIGGVVIHYFTSKSQPFFWAYTIEESLEMLGIILFIYALLIYLFDDGGSLTIIGDKNNAIPDRFIENS